MTVLANRRIGVGDVQISEKARANVNEALLNNRLSYGPFSREFERRFAEIHLRRFACFVNSGTDALRIGLAAMKEKYGWQDGDQVIVPALTFVASVNVIIQNGLTPVLVDIEPDYGIDWAQVMEILGHQEAQGGRIVGTMPVHLFGRPVTIPPIVRAVTRVIADSCETMFVPGCAAGEVSCFSTYACHVIQTGVGGIATTNDPELAALIRSYANHGRSGVYASIDADLGVREVMDARFHFDRIGYSSRATEMEAGIGCAALDDWQDNLARRRANAAALTSGLERLPLRLPRVRPGAQSAWMMYPIRAQDRVVRDALVKFLEDRGVETRPLLPLTNQPYLRALLGEDLEGRYPVAAQVNATGFYVGCQPSLTDEDIAYMVSVFRSFYT